ncbi:MAG TPA: nucleotidyltransferase family protein [Terracidiphilus sp.]|jgi:NDP-sugar pyrophosphorylase family protein
MKAMILAAGLGTRLRPLTDDRPKALVTVAGRTLLDITLTRLRTFGVSDVIVNTHHYADMMRAYLEANHNFGMHIEISQEDILLDTGGGLRHAAHFFADSDAPFILHNVDVLSTIDLARMLRFHVEQDALATLAVQDRRTSRYLLFNEEGRLCGRRAGLDRESEIVSPARSVIRLAFSGIHVISPRLFGKMIENGVFSIIPAYLRMAALGNKIIAFRADEYYWRDLGRPENIRDAALDIADGVYPGL